MAKIGMENIIQSWSCLLPGQASKKDKFFSLIESEISNRRNGLRTEKEDVGARFGRKRTFLTIPYIDNMNWRVYYGFEDFGVDLMVTWDLYSKDPLKGGERIGLFTSDFIEISSIKTFAAVTHNCAVAAVEAIFDESNLDKTKIHRESSGALGPI